MTKIKDDNSAKVGISGLFGGGASQGVTFQETPLSSKEEIEATLEDSTREALRKEIERRKYLKAGRPPKGSEKKGSDSVRMTFIVSSEKQDRLREIALQKGLFIRELLDRAIDLVIEEYEKEERI